MTRKLLALLLCLLLVSNSTISLSAGIVGDVVVGSDKDHPVSNPAADIAGDQAIGAIVERGKRMTPAPAPASPRVPTPTPTTPAGGNLNPRVPPTPSAPSGASNIGKAIVI